MNKKEKSRDVSKNITPNRISNNQIKDYINDVRESVEGVFYCSNDEIVECLNHDRTGLQMLKYNHHQFCKNVIMWGFANQTPPFLLAGSLIEMSVSENDVLDAVDCIRENIPNWVETLNEIKDRENLEANQDASRN